MNIHLGFTGTQEGLTKPQMQTLRDFLSVIEFDVAHHGMCIGADEEFHYIVETDYPRVAIIGHPPKNETKMAKGLKCYLMSNPYEYLKRNRHIVEQSSIIICCPKTQTEITRSGTWSTFRYAKKMGKDITMIYPDGSIVNK